METKKRLCRSRTNKMFAGVCGGIAEYFGIDATIVRVLAIVIPGIGWGTYLVCMIIMPSE